MEKNDNKLYTVINDYNENSNEYIELGMLDGELTIVVHSCEQSDEIDALLVEHELGRYEVVFSDEYSMCGGSCNGCCNLVRTSPDSYFWTAPYLSEDGYMCDECASKYSDEMLEEYKNEERNIPDCFNTAELGLSKVNKDEYRNGWFPDMNDDPKPIRKAFNDAGIDIWFKVRPSQFYIEYDVYVKELDIEKARSIIKL